jgi:hypothetical protein
MMVNVGMPGTKANRRRIPDQPVCKRVYDTPDQVPVVGPQR